MSGFLIYVGLIVVAWQISRLNNTLSARLAAASTDIQPGTERSEVHHETGDQP
jgi:hypothetical protein